MSIYNWFNHKSEKQKKVVQIPIQCCQEKSKALPIHISKINRIKLDKTIVDALGGLNNIESFCPVPNSRRIRLTLNNPSFIDKYSLEQIDMHLCMRIGKKIVHIIP